MADLVPQVNSMEIIKFDRDNMLNGSGIRLVVWFRGCNHHCDECHNPETWNFQPHVEDLGNAMEEAVLSQIINELNKPHYAGITLTGGCPFCQNLTELCAFLHAIKTYCPEKNIWCWAGETYEELISNPMSKRCLEMIDVLIDGPYIKEKHNLTKYSGSSNQRVIDVQESLKANTVVFWKEEL